jgi:hypothetical protein
MKIVSVRVEIKQGLPNYSSRVADVQAVADESESLEIVKTVRGLSEEIKTAWGGEKTTPPATIAVGIKEEPSKVAAPTPVKMTTNPAQTPKKDNVVELPLTKPAPKKTSNPLDED